MLRKKPSPPEAGRAALLRLVWRSPVALAALLAAASSLAPLSALASSAPGASSSPGDPVREEILKINYIFNRELYDLALERYEKLLAENPGYARADLIQYPIALCHYNLAVKEAPGGAGSKKKPASLGAARKEHLKKAVASLKEALRQKELEARWEAMRLLGQSLLLLEDFEGAAKTFQWILERTEEPKEAISAGLGLAESLYSQGKYAQASEAYRKVLAKGPEAEDRSRAEYHLALSLYRAKEVREAIPLFEKAAAPVGTAEAAAKARSPYADDARYMLALARQEAGDAKGAVEELRALAASGSEAYGDLARFGLASALFQAGELKEAAGELRSFIDAFPSSERRDAAALLLARALLETGEPSAGAKVLQDLRSSASVGDEASLWLARLYARHGKAKSAATVLAAALKARPRSRLREALELELASARIADGDFEAAGELLGRLEAGGAKGSADEVAYLKAYALHRAKKYTESLAECARFRESFPSSAHLKDVSELEAENKLLSGDAAGAGAAYRGHLSRFEKELDGVSKLKARFRAAQALHLEKKPAEARDALEHLGAADLGPEAEKAFREDPFFAAFRYLVGDCSYQLKDHERARAELLTFLAEREARGGGLEAEAADARFKAAHSLQLAGSLKEAREAYASALEADPRSPHREQILFEEAQIAYAGKENGEAAKLFERVLAEFPAGRFAPHALKFLGWIAFDSKDLETAASRYAKLLAEFPAHPAAADADYHLAQCLGALGRSGEAREALARFQAKNPGDPRAARLEVEEAAALSKAGRHREALEALEKLAGSKPPADVLPSVLYETAWCHRGLSDLDSAAKAYRDLIALEASGALRDTASLELGELELERKEPGRAAEILEPLASRPGPHREKALYRLVWCRHQLGDAPGVIAGEQAFAEGFPSSDLAPELGLLAARARLKSGDTAKACAIFQRVAEARPDAPEAEAALVSLGECLAEERRFDEAKARFASFLKRYPKSAQAYRARFGEAWAAENLGRIDEAIEMYRQVLRETKTATAARAQFQLGQCLVARKDYRSAIVEFLQVPAAYSYPEWTSKALLQAAGCFEALEDGDNARKYYAEVASTFPGRDEAKLAEERLRKLETQ